MPSHIDNYTCVKTLGSGVSAKVKLAQNPQGHLVALKVFQKSNPQNTEQAMKTLIDEVKAYSQLKQANIVQLFEFKEDAIWRHADGRQEHVAYCALEYVNGGELFDFVAQGAFNDRICRYYFKQMLQSMHYTHTKGFAHRDLKPENMMLDKDFNLKIADFGFAAPTQGRDGSGYLNTRLGTIAYMAPELILNEPYQGHVVDLFALAIILFILYAGHPPFNQAHPTDVHYKLLVTNRADLFWKYHSKGKAEGFFTENFKDLITNMLQSQPNQRLNIADIIGHPWMMEGVADHKEVVQEFAQRHELIKQQQAQEAMERNASKMHKKTFRGENQGKVYLTDEATGQVTQVDQPFEESKEDEPKLKIDLFNKEIHRNAELCSTSRPSEIFNFLASNLKEMNHEHQRDQNKWKMTFELLQEQSEEEKNTEQPQQGCRVTAKLLKVDEDRTCIEFTRTMGSGWLYNEQMKKLRDKLKELNDAVLC